MKIIAIGDSQANADPHLPFDRQPPELLFWERFGYPEPHVSGKTMVCGHSSKKSGLPRNVGHAICIDTYSGFRCIKHSSFEI